MKKFAGVSITVIAITIFMALIPLIIFGEDSISSNRERSYLTGNFLFVYILIFGICCLIFEVVTKAKKYFEQDLPKVYVTIAYILICSIITGGLLGLFIPKQMQPSSADDPFQFYYEFNFLATFIPMGIGAFVSLLIYGNHLSKK